MDIYELIKNRASIRSYKSDPVPHETVMRVIDAARLAPSWANKQCWRYIIVDSKVEKNLLGKASGQANIAKACEDAPYVIVLCADPKDSGSKNGLNYFMFDCALSMGNLILASQSEGLSTCIIGWFDEKAVKGILNLPPTLHVIAYTPLGYANENVPVRRRKAASEIAYHNFWGKQFE